MHSTDTRSQFLELRAKGWSLARIAAKIQVSPRTLVDWNRQHRDELRALRAIGLEALQERVLAGYEHELACLAGHLERIEAEIATRQYTYESTRDLFRLAALLRSEIRKTRLEPEFEAEAPAGSAATGAAGPALGPAP